MLIITLNWYSGKVFAVENERKEKREKSTLEKFVCMKKDSGVFCIPHNILINFFQWGKHGVSDKVFGKIHSSSFFFSHTSTGNLPLAWLILTTAIFRDFPEMNGNPYRDDIRIAFYYQKIKVFKSNDLSNEQIDGGDEIP